MLLGLMLAIGCEKSTEGVADAEDTAGVEVAALAITPPAPSSSEALLAVLTPEAPAPIWRWFTDGVERAEWTGPEVPGGETAKGEIWRVEVDADGESLSAEVAIGGVTPEVLELTLTPERIWTDDLLVATVTAVDPDGDAFSLRYEWTVDGAPAGGDDGLLDGALDFDRDQEVALTVTVSDVDGEGASLSAGPLVVQNTAPGAPVITVEPATGYPGEQDLVCRVVEEAEDLDGDTLEYTYAWTVDEAPYAGTGDTVPAADTALGRAWTCTVTAWDDADEGGSDSASAEVYDEPYAVGNDVEFTDSSSHSANYLLGSRLVLETAGELQALAVIGKVAGPRVVMALYSEDSTGNPDALVAETDATSIVVGGLELPVEPVELDAGAYWIVAVFESSASVGFNMATSAEVKYCSHSFSSPLPDPFCPGGISVYSGQEFNYYTVMR